MSLTQMLEVVALEEAGTRTQGILLDFQTKSAQPAKLMDGATIERASEDEESTTLTGERPQCVQLCDIWLCLFTWSVRLIRGNARVDISSFLFLYSVLMFVHSQNSIAVLCAP